MRERKEARTWMRRKKKKEKKIIKDLSKDHTLYNTFLSLPPPLPNRYQKLHEGHPGGNGCPRSSATLRLLDGHLVCHHAAVAPGNCLFFFPLTLFIVIYLKLFTIKAGKIYILD